VASHSAITSRIGGASGSVRSLPNRSFIERAVILSTADTVAAILGRYGLVIVIGWLGALKFANFEAHQIQPLVAHSPFMGWLYSFLPVYTFSALLGVFEVAAAVLLAFKPIAPKLSIAGPTRTSTCVVDIGERCQRGGTDNESTVYRDAGDRIRGDRPRTGRLSGRQRVAEPRQCSEHRCSGTSRAADRPTPTTIRRQHECIAIP
jgi:hypothetical protein